MKYFIFFVLWWMSLPGFGQEKPVPEFFINDPSIYKKGALCIPSSYLKSFTFNQELAEVIIKDTSGNSEIKRKGFINTKGKFIILPEYIKTETSPYGIIALLNEAGNWKFYKIGSGNIEHQGEFQEYGIISPRYILVCKKNKWGILIINKKQTSLIDPVFKRIEKVSENTFKFYHFNSWILKNKSMDSLKSFFYDSLAFCNDSLIAYRLNKTSGIIDYHGKEVVADIMRCNRAEAANDNDKSEVQELIKVKENDRYGIADSNGKIIIPVEYDSIRGPYENVFMVYREGKMGITNTKGIIMSELSNRFEYAFPFCEERAIIVKAGKYGFIDQRGNVRVAPQYSSVRNFKEGAAAVVINGKWGFIDKDEKIIVQPHYTEVADFKNGVARAKTGAKWYFVNKDGKKLSNAYDQIKEIDIDKDKWILINNSRQGLADKTGKELLAPRYDFLGDLEKGMVIVKKAERWGVVDYRENFVSPIEFDYVIYNKASSLFLFMRAGKEEVMEIKSEP